MRPIGTKAAAGTGWNILPNGAAGFTFSSGLLARFRNFCGLLAGVGLVNLGVAESLRVTTWNLGIAGAAPATTSAVLDAAVILGSLDPDVILLQGVRDWRQCSQLARALGPGTYRVVVCSAFHHSLPVRADQTQVAILSKSAAFFSWSESWPPRRDQGLAQGAAFAAIQMDTQRLGFFTAVFDDPSAGEELGRRLLEQISSIGRWETNQVQTFVVAASSGAFVNNPTPLLRKSVAAFEDAGLVDAAEEIPLELKHTLRPGATRTQAVGDCLCVGPLGFPQNMRITASPAADHYPVTCDIELDPDKVTMALDIRAENHRERSARASAERWKIAYWTLGGLACAIGISAVSKRRSKKCDRKDAHQRSNQPLRVVPKRTTGPVRPIIFVQAPAKSVASDAPVQIPPQRPILRLETDKKLEERKSEAPDQALVPSATDLAEHARIRPQPSSARPKEGSHGEPPPHDAEVRKGVIKELSSWLKQMFVRKLVSDRAELLQAHQLATHMAAKLDSRLSRIEAQIQQQNQAYVRRIEQLNLELAAAREENRELIRERIAQVKAEMEAARERVIAEANLEGVKLRL